jgi:hypothetical protein
MMKNAYKRFTVAQKTRNSERAYKQSKIAAKEFGNALYILYKTTRMSNNVRNGLNSGLRKTPWFQTNNSEAIPYFMH